MGLYTYVYTNVQRGECERTIETEQYTRHNARGYRRLRRIINCVGGGKSISAKGEPFKVPGDTELMRPRLWANWQFRFPLNARAALRQISSPARPPPAPHHRQHPPPTRLSTIVVAITRFRFNPPPPLVFQRGGKNVITRQTKHAKYASTKFTLRV